MEATFERLATRFGQWLSSDSKASTSTNASQKSTDWKHQLAKGIQAEIAKGIQEETEKQNAAKNRGSWSKDDWKHAYENWGPGKWRRKPRGCGGGGSSSRRSSSSSDWWQTSSSSSTPKHSPSSKSSSKCPRKRSSCHKEYKSKSQKSKPPQKPPLKPPQKPMPSNSENSDEGDARSLLSAQQKDHLDRLKLMGFDLDRSLAALLSKPKGSLEEILLILTSDEEDAWHAGPAAANPDAKKGEPVNLQKNNARDRDVSEPDGAQHDYDIDVDLAAQAQVNEVVDKVKSIGQKFFNSKNKS